MAKSPKQLMDELEIYMTNTKKLSNPTENIRRYDAPQRKPVEYESKIRPIHGQKSRVKLSRKKVREYEAEYQKHSHPGMTDEEFAKWVKEIAYERALNDKLGGK